MNYHACQRLALLLLMPVLGCGRDCCDNAPSDSARSPAARTSEKIPDCCELDRGGLLTGTVQGGANKPTAGAIPDRNPVNMTDKNVPTDWSVEDGKLRNVKWVAALGSRGYSAPVVAGGRVFVATNNKVPRDKNAKGHRAVLMCFNETDGKFLWQAVHAMAPPEVDQQAADDGLCSRPTVEGDRVYFVTPGSVVICASVKDGKTLWSYDLMKQLKVYTCIMNSCSPLIVGDRVFVVTANGVDPQGAVREPKAPSFVALNKKTGELLWQNNLPGDQIIEGQWGSPVYAEANGKGQVIFPGGDGWLYSLEPDTGKLIWKFECNPPKKGEQPGDRDKRNHLVSTPVVHGSRVCVGIGRAPETGTEDRVGRFWCIDITKKGDVSPINANLDPQAPENKSSALVWHYGGLIEPRPKSGRPVVFGPTISTCTVHDGLVYISEEHGYFHCLDAQTGKKLWEHDFKTGIWGSPYWVDGKVYMGADDGTMYIFSHGREKRILAEIDMGDTIHAPAIVANGVLYVTTRSKVYAIGK